MSGLIIAVANGPTDMVEPRRAHILPNAASYVIYPDGYIDREKMEATAFREGRAQCAQGRMNEYDSIVAASAGPVPGGV